MLKVIDSKTTKATCKVYCKRCCRKEYHFLNVRGGINRFILKLVTLGTIGFFGQYRCVCCGTSRIGRFDIIRGRAQKEASLIKHAPGIRCNGGLVVEKAGTVCNVANGGKVCFRDRNGKKSIVISRSAGNFGSLAANGMCGPSANYVVRALRRCTCTNKNFRFAGRCF